MMRYTKRGNMPTERQNVPFDVLNYDYLEAYATLKNGETGYFIINVNGNESAINLWDVATIHWWKTAYNN